MESAATSQPTCDAVPAELCDAIRGARRVAIAGHVTPDADCVGSIAALWLALPELGVAPAASLPPETVARRLRFLVEGAGLTSASAAELGGCDLLVGVDTAKEPRLSIVGGAESVAGVPIANVDHHATNTQYGKWNWICGERSSTCEMVYELLVALGCQITPTIATLLYAGVHSDTQGFTLSNTTPRSLQVGYELAAAGADLHGLGEKLHRSQSRSEFELLQAVYRNTRVIADGRIAYSTASHAEITGAGCNANDIDDQVEVPRSVEGIAIAMLLTEGNPGKVRINFRGEGGLSVLDLARQFGGGGHHASAGAILDGTVDDAAPRVVAAAEAYLAERS